MKKFGTALAALLLTAIFAFGLAACGPKDDGRTRITIWCQITQENFFKNLENDFETKNPEIDLNIVAQPQDNLGQSLDARLIASNAPDIVACNGGLVAGTLVKSGRLMNINDLIEPIEEHLAGGAQTNKQDGNGEYYTAPLHGFASPVIFYNKDMFEDMKTSDVLTDEQKAAVKEPDTYQELKDLAAVCKIYTAATSSTGVGHSLVAGFSTWHLPHFMQAIHSRTMSVEDYNKLLDKNADPNPFDTDAFEDGWRLLRKYLDDGILDAGITGYDVNAADMYFYYGSAALRMGVSLDYPTLKDGATFEIGAFYLPKEEAFPDSPRANSIYSDVLAVNAITKAPEACRTFISYVMQADVQAALADDGLYPARVDANIEGKMDDTLVKLFEELQNGSNDFYQSWSYAGIDIQLLDAGRAVLDAEPADLEDAYDAARKLIADYFDAGKAAANQ